VIDRARAYHAGEALEVGLLDDHACAPVVELLEDLLTRARAGEIRAIGVAAQTCDGCDLTAYRLGDGTVAVLHLAATRLRDRILEVT